MARLRESKPHLACEIAVQNLIAARARSDATALEVHTVRELAPDTIRPSLTAGNVSNVPALGQSIASALSAVGGRKRDVVAIIPDAAVRVLLMDFDKLPDKAAEAEPIIRFRSSGRI
jgi:type IV pilus assembly protein PilM